MEQEIPQPPFNLGSFQVKKMVVEAEVPNMFPKVGEKLDKMVPKRLAIHRVLLILLWICLGYPNQNKNMSTVAPFNFSSI